jgi:hypothetical protein
MQYWLEKAFLRHCTTITERDCAIFLITGSSIRRPDCGDLHALRAELDA